MPGEPIEGAPAVCVNAIHSKQHNSSTVRNTCSPDSSTIATNKAHYKNSNQNVKPLDSGATDAVALCLAAITKRRGRLAYVADKLRRSTGAGAHAPSLDLGQLPAAAALPEIEARFSP